MFVEVTVEKLVGGPFNPISSAKKWGVFDERAFSYLI